MKKYNILSYSLVIIIGFIMVLGVIAKLMNILDFSSDWFWLIAGLGLIIEGTISLIKQRNFDRKYKIILRKDK